MSKKLIGRFEAVRARRSGARERPPPMSPKHWARIAILFGLVATGCSSADQFDQAAYDAALDRYAEMEAAQLEVTCEIVRVANREPSVAEAQYGIDSVEQYVRVLGAQEGVAQELVEEHAEESAAAILKMCETPPSTVADSGIAAFAGFRFDPVPVVGDLSLPDLTAGDEEFTLTASPGRLLLVYFGYTNSLDFVPTTLSDTMLAINRLDDPSMVDVAVITVDPDRDLPVLADYVQGFFPGGHALGTDDDRLLEQVADRFDVGYAIEKLPNGEIEVTHTTSLFAVNDEGELIALWPFATGIDELRNDLSTLRDEATSD